MSKRVLHVKLPSWLIYPGGMVYLADYLYKNVPGIEQKITDLSFIKPSHQKAYLLQQIKEFKPDFIAFSWRNIQTFAPHEDSPALRIVFKYDHSHLVNKLGAVFSGAAEIINYRRQMNRNLSFLKLVSKNFPHIKLAIGGGAFSIYPEELIKKCPSGTAGAVGEGEKALLKLVKGEDVLAEDTVVNNNGNVVNGAGPNYLNMEELEPVDFSYINRIFDRFSYFVKNDYIGVQTKRGCPYKCMFCLYNRIEGHHQRFKRAEVIAEEVERLNRDFGVKNIWFTDAQFCASKESIIESEKLLDELISRNLDIKWSGNIRVELLNKEFIQKAINSGLKDLHLTFTGSQKVINKLKLGYNLENQLEALDYFYNARNSTSIKFKLYLALNVPGETEQTLRETISLCQKLRQKYGEDTVTPYIFLLAVQPGTPLEEYAIQTGHLKANYKKLSANPFLVKNLLYNPPPLGKPIALSFLKALKEIGNGNGVGWHTLENLKKKIS